MLSLLTAFVLAAAPLQDTAHVVLVATTDLHGHATDWDYVADRPFAGGIARVATVVDSLRAKYPGQVVVVDAGDLLQGDAFATYFARVAPRDPHPIIEALNLTGYDAATPGNHDFDWGLPFFRRAVADARFPYVSANMYSRARRLAALSRRSASSGARASASRSPASPRPGRWCGTGTSSAAGCGSRRFRPAAAAVLEAMRRDADVTVALVHSGLGGRASYDTAGVGDENVAAALASLPGASGRRRGGALAPGDARLGHRRRPLRPARRRSARASRWCTSIWRASDGGLAHPPGAGGPGLHARAWPPRRCWRSAWPRRATRCAPGRGRRSGWRLAPMRAGAARVEPAPDPRTSSRTCSGGAPARSCRRRRRSTSGRGSTPTPSAWPTCSRSIRSTTPCAPCG